MDTFRALSCSSVPGVTLASYKLDVALNKQWKFLNGNKVFDLIQTFLVHLYVLGFIISWIMLVMAVLGLWFRKAPPIPSPPNYIVHFLNCKVIRWLMCLSSIQVILYTCVLLNHCTIPFFSYRVIRMKIWWMLENLKDHHGLLLETH